MKWKFHPRIQQEMWADRKEFNDTEDQSIQFIQSGKERMQKNWTKPKRNMEHH